MKLMSSKSNLALFLVLIVAHTAVFWFSDIDIQVASYFYHPEQENPWPLGETTLWMFFYKLGPILTIAIALSSLLVILIASLKKSWTIHRHQAAFILLCFVIGPGLIVNTLFKDNWGRPRPAQVIQFQGAEQYVPPLMYNAAGDGKSFPSGHSSLGFAFIAFWFLWRKRRPLLANAALGFSLFLGTMLGISRMSAGGHFLSDVFWSLWIPLLTSMTLYHFFFKRSLEGENTSQDQWWKSTLYGGAAFAILAYGVFNWPAKQTQTQTIETHSIVNFLADKTHLKIEYKAIDDNHIEIRHRVNGFGLPFSKQLLSVDTEGDISNIKIKASGFFTELESETNLILPINHSIHQLHVKIKNGAASVPPSLESAIDQKESILD